MTGSGNGEHSWTDAIVGAFLRSNLSLVLLLLAIAAGAAALELTPREEDPQIVVPLADVHVRFPGRSAREVEQLVASPLEQLLFQIDGVEHVYSMSREGSAVITVRFFVGEDRERSLVKLKKRIDENVDLVPPEVEGWVVKPVEIDDVPIVTLTLRSATPDSFALRRVAEEMAARMARVEDVSRVTITGGESRVAHVFLDPSRLEAYDLSPLEVLAAVRASNATLDAGTFERGDVTFAVEVGPAVADPHALADLVVAVRRDSPVFLGQVARVVDGPDEARSYVRHGFGPSHGFEPRPDIPGTRIGPAARNGEDADGPVNAVTLAVAKKKGTNAVDVAARVLDEARRLKHEIVPDDVELVLTRNSGRTADDKVNELLEALGVAVFIVIALLTLALGWRESLVVALAVPIVFGLTLAINMMFGLTINRVTLFALILSIGLLVDDPIVDVENITRHFALRGRATREIVIEAIREIRPPLISATLAVIVSFLPMFFITGMMGPYMQPMAVGVPVAMAMSLLVAFTITPWLAFHLLRGRYRGGAAEANDVEPDPEDVKRTRLYKVFYPLMAPILSSRPRAWAFLIVFLLATVAAASLALTRHVPLKMLPFDNKSELQLVIDASEGTTLERTDAAVRDLETFVAGVPEVVDFTSYVGLASPMDFNGLVRHDYLREGPAVAEVRLNLVGKKSRETQSHAIGLRLRGALDAIAAKHDVIVKVVELPPGPPVLATVVAEVTGPSDAHYDDLIRGAEVVRERLAREPGVVDIDTSVEAQREKLIFTTDQEKAALNGVSVDEVARTMTLALGGASAGTVRAPDERQPLEIRLRLPRAVRSSANDLSRLRVAGAGGSLVPLPEIGRWESSAVDRTIHHKDLVPVVYVLAEIAGRPPADVVMDIQADRVARGRAPGVEDARPRPVEERSFFSNGGGVPWSVGPELDVAFDGEGEWDITLDVFRDLGLAFAAALLAIYVILVAQTTSFLVPVVVMLAIPLTILGIMPGFWLLNAIGAGSVGGYADTIDFTATGMIGMIALAGIVTRDSIILVDFIHKSQAKGRSLFDAIMESRVVRLRPILLTSATAMLSAAPIAIDPIFSGLAWSLIFGLFASTVFTLFVIPVTYWLAYAGRDDRPPVG